MKMLSLCSILLASGLTDSAVARAPGAGQWIAAIDYRLTGQRPRPQAPAIADGGTNGAMTVAGYRLASPTMAAPPPPTIPLITLRRDRLSFDTHPSAALALRSIHPAVRASQFDLSAEHDHALWRGTHLTLGWHTTRLSTRDASITADGGTGYRRQRSDLFLPSIALRSDIAPGLVLDISHAERLRANMDSAYFGPRSMTQTEWTLGDRTADFQRSLSNSVRLSWQAGAIDLRARIASTGYHNRMIADEHGLLRPLSGALRAHSYGLAAGWRITPHLRLSASALTEEMRARAASRRNAFSAGLEQRTADGGFHLHVLRQDVADFADAAPGWRPAWGVEAAVDRRIAGPDMLPDMMLTLRARSIADSIADEEAASALASRDLQPQIRVGLLARW